MQKRDWQADWELCEKATPGPWIWEDWEEDNGPNRYTLTAPPETRPDYPGLFPWLRNYLIADEEHGISEADRKFIAEAREALPYWLARVRELEEDVIELEADVGSVLVRLEEAEERIRQLEAENARLKAVAEAAREYLRIAHEWQGDYDSVWCEALDNADRRLAEALAALEE